MTREQDAEHWLYNYLGKLLGGDRSGLASYGLRYDPKSKQQYIGVEFARHTPASILDRVPKSVRDVDVRVGRVSLELERARA
jgi:hypothetical protein